jgi:AraC-like DNA-binding protein/mannose-6-phosphate isomerase-like protein (cupin superfamily)
MDANELSKYLSEFSDTEKLYRQYHWINGDPTALRDFLDNIDPAIMDDINFFIPDLANKLPMDFSKESWYWGEEAQDIYVHKHARYMPTKPFFHSFYECHFLYAGHNTIEFQDETIEMDEGDVCIIAPETQHIVRVFDDHSIDIVVKIRKSTFKSAFPAILSGHNSLANFFNDTLYINKHTGHALYRYQGDSGVKRLFIEIYLEHYNKKPYFRQSMNQELSMLFFRLLRNEKDKSGARTTFTPPLTTPSDGIYRMRAILDFIKHNYIDITLRKLSSEFHFAEQYMSKYIKEHSGMTYSEIVRSIKLEKALELLDTTDMTISNISAEVGYKSPENFMRQFKARYGTSPTSYRKRAGHRP